MGVPVQPHAYPWYTSVRKILDADACSDWFVKFKPDAPWYSPKCDNNYNPPKCSDYFHMQEQTPNYPHGDGDCAAPACDCGTKPCGFYLWNHSSTTVVNGQTFQDWFIHDYMFNEVGRSPRLRLLLGRLHAGRVIVARRPLARREAQRHRGHRPDAAADG